MKIQKEVDRLKERLEWQRLSDEYYAGMDRKRRPSEVIAGICLVAIVLMMIILWITAR